MFDKGEGMSIGDIRKHQEKMLRDVVRYAYDNVPLYREKFKSAGITPEDIRSLDDLEKIPFTTKNNLRAAYPYGLLAVGIDRVVRFHASSGTTGKPTVVPFTSNDIEVQSLLMARSLSTATVTKDDIVQNAYTYGLFTGGLMFHYGAEKLGAAVIPSATGNTRRQIEIMRDMRTTVLCCTPSYTMRIKEVANEMGLEPSKDFSLRVGVFGAEPWSEGMRKKIENALGLEAFDMYGLSELGGPGVAIECSEHDGLHVWSDHYIVEVIDPKSGEVLGEGEKGELVFTTLTKEAMPLLRYRTRDISSIIPGTCSCGREHPRISRIEGRSDDMLIVGGINVFPSAIEEVLSRFSELGSEYQIVVDRDVLDHLLVRAEVVDKSVDRKSLAKRVAEELQAVLAIRARLELVDEGTLPRAEGKAKRVIDLRKGKI